MVRKKVAEQTTRLNSTELWKPKVVEVDLMEGHNTQSRKARVIRDLVHISIGTAVGEEASVVEIASGAGIQAWAGGEGEFVIEAATELVAELEHVSIHAAVQQGNLQNNICTRPT